MRTSSMRRAVLVGALALLLAAPAAAWAAPGNGPEKGDDHPSTQRNGNGPPPWAAQGPPPWAMNDAGPNPWAAAACAELTDVERDECLAERHAVRLLWREDRRAMKLQWHAERGEMKVQWRQMRQLVEDDGEVDGGDAPTD